MDDTLFLFVVVFTTFCAIPGTVLIWQKTRKLLVVKGYIKQQRGSIGNRAALEAYLFIETDIGLYLDVFQVILSMISCACFVAEMYHENLPEDTGWQIAELTMGVVFAVDYSFRFYLAKDKINYFFSPLAIIDFVTVLPTFVFAAMAMKGSSVTFLRVLRLMRALRVLRVLKILRLVMGKHATAAQSDVTRMCIKAGFTVLCMIFCAAAFFAIVEGMDFHVALYYVCIEALSRPNSPVMTVPGYCLMYVLVILTITALPPQLATVVVAFKNQTDDTMLKLKETDTHIVLCGDITHYELSEVFDSLFADTSLGFRVCVMMPKPPNVYMKRTIDDVNSEVPGAVTVITGTVMAPADLANAQAKRASRIIVFSQLQVKDKAALDRITMARAMAIKCFAPMVPLCCMVLLPETRNQIAVLPKWRPGHDQVICVETLKIQLLSLNIFVPGAITLISNLVSTSSSQIERAEGEGLWVEDYARGLSNSVFELEMPVQFTGHSFTKVAWSCFCKYGVMLIGIGRDSMGERRVVLNPGIKNIVKPGDMGYWICESQQQIEKIGFELAKNSKSTDTAPVFDVTVGAVFSMLETPNDGALVSPFEAMGSHAELERQVAVQMSPMSPDSRPASHINGKNSVRGTPIISNKPSNVDLTDFEPNSTKKAQTKERQELLRKFCNDTYDCDLYQLVHDAFRGSESEWVWCTVNQESQEPGMRIGSPAMRPTAGELIDEASWGDADEEDPTYEPQVRENVIICGSSYSIKYLVQTLLSGGCQVTLVNLQANAMLKEEWCASQYVIGVQGAPDDEQSLLQAGMSTCFAAIILGHESPKVSGQGDIDAFIQDTRAVTITNIFSKHSTVFVMLELINLASVDYVSLPNSQSASGLGPSLAYAGGRIYSSVLSTQIVARVHTLPAALQLVEQLLWTNLDTEETNNEETAGMNSKFALSLIDLPKYGDEEGQKRERCFGELAFHLMMSSGCIPLGIFRQPGPSHYPYVMCNPPASTEMKSSDQLYVINSAWSAGQKLADIKVPGWTPQPTQMTGSQRYASCPVLSSPKTTPQLGSTEPPEVLRHQDRARMLTRGGRRASTGATTGLASIKEQLAVTPTSSPQIQPQQPTRSDSGLSINTRFKL